ncbi:MAG: formylglycine-generating enzyme family protein [Cohaesibacteraceae bacterium]|nr:formylglycine-generating enzyme family protein [Cohaesibacteraceae bacterium]
MNTNNINSPMQEIPAGEITMRDDRLKTSWNVTLQSFWLGRYPVTQELYRAVSGKSPSTFSKDAHPVESVSWLDAVLFCNQLSEKSGLPEFYLVGTSETEIGTNAASGGYRLPTEAEWEFACRAGTTGIRYGVLDEIAWVKANSAGSTQAVGQKQANKFGLHDMLGNVWEWCDDLYDAEVYGSYRVFRGGGWADGERGCMVTNRRRSHPTFQIDDLGFRVARSISTC